MLGTPVCHVPTHELVLHSELFEGDVLMGVCSALPYEDVIKGPTATSVPLVSSRPGNIRNSIQKCVRHVQ